MRLRQLVILRGSRNRGAAQRLLAFKLDARPEFVKRLRFGVSGDRIPRPVISSRPKSWGRSPARLLVGTYFRAVSARTCGPERPAGSNERLG